MPREGKTRQKKTKSREIIRSSQIRNPEETKRKNWIKTMETSLPTQSYASAFLHPLTLLIKSVGSLSPK